MAHFLLAVHTDYSADPGPDFDMDAVFKAVDDFNQKVMADGIWVYGGGLNPPSDATVVSAADGGVVTTDGPYLETKEVLGGFWIIDVADRAAAEAIATQGSAACQGKVEVRSFQPE